MNLTSRQREILQRLADNADGKDPEDEWTLLREGNGFWIGPERCTRTANSLEWLMLIKPDGGSAGSEYYQITEAGRKALADPEYEAPGTQIMAGRIICDCPPHKKEPTRYGICGYCSRQLVAVT